MKNYLTAIFTLLNECSCFYNLVLAVQPVSPIFTDLQLLEGMKLTTLINSKGRIFDLELRNKLYI